MPPAPSNRPDRDETPVTPARDRGDACPGALRLHTADDGALARVRVPAGVLSAAQAYALADAAERLGDGALDITSRGNLQLRGLGAGCGRELAALLDTAGLLPSPRHERVRNVVASPLSGLDGQGHTDVQPLVRELDALLCASERATELSGRFLFSLDDGRGDMAELAADVMLLAERGGANARVTVGEATVRVRTEDGPRVMLLAACAFLDAAAASATRAWRARELPAAYAVSAADLAGRTVAAGIEATPVEGADTPAGDAARAALPLSGDSPGAGAVVALPEGGGVSAPTAPGGNPAADAGGPGRDAASVGGSARPSHVGGAVTAAGGVTSVHRGAGSAGQETARAALPLPGDSPGAGAVVASSPERAGHERPGAQSAPRGPGLVRGVPGSGVSGAHVQGRDGNGVPRPGHIRGPGRGGLYALVPLGRVTASAWRLLAATAERYGTGELRVTPWRGVVVPGAGKDRMGVLAGAGLVTGSASPWLGVGACTGRPGCAKSLADVRADATALLPAGAGGLPVYWSGCERRCGHPRGAAVAVVAAGDGRYEVTAPGAPPQSVPLHELAGALEAARAVTTQAPRSQHTHQSHHTHHTHQTSTTTSTTPTK
ncbi:hypothetical protein [Streptomyces sp. NPDC003023]|uniref:hypothetical protein n=1 Tax=Streptomyces sp. NPDC003023 TaxID=3364675 RepID=UPI0036B8645F